MAINEKQLTRGGIINFTTSLFISHKNISILCDESLAKTLLMKIQMEDYHDVVLNFQEGVKEYIVTKILGSAFIIEPALENGNRKYIEASIIVLANGDKLTQEDLCYFSEDDILWVLGEKNTGLLLGGNYTLEFGDNYGNRQKMYEV